MIQRITLQNRSLIDQFLIEHWYTLTMVVRGQEVDMSVADGFFYTQDDRLLGLITYTVTGKTLEILSLDSVQPGCGIGTALLQQVIREARSLGCSKIVLITTNDNLHALRFYQRRGFDMVHLYRNALKVSRKLKPEIPLIGEYGIPLRHEIELEMLL